MKPCAALFMALASLSAFAAGPFDEAKTKAAAGRELIESTAALREAGETEELQEAERNASRLVAEARRLYESNRVLESSDLEAIVDFANLYELTHDDDLAAEAFERAMALAPTDATYALSAGLARARLGTADGARALDHFEAVLKNTEDAATLADANAGRGDVYWTLRFYDLSLEAYRAALDLNAAHVGAHIGAAVCLTRRGDVTAASELLDALGPLPPQQSYDLRERLRRALLDFQNDRVWFTDTAAHHLDYGKLLLRADRMPESLLAIGRSVELDGTNYVAWNMLGSVALQMGQQDQAQRAFENSLKVNPGQERTRQTLEAMKKAAQKPAPPQDFVTRPDAPSTP